MRDTTSGWAKRIGWFVALYVASFAAIALVATGLKAVIAH